MPALAKAVINTCIHHAKNEMERSAKDVIRLEFWKIRMLTISDGRFQLRLVFSQPLEAMQRVETFKRDRLQGKLCVLRQCTVVVNFARECICECIAFV